MGLNEYQDSATSFALYQNTMYPIASLMVESAELADMFIKPRLRGDLEPISRQEIISEAGDVLWNLSNLLKDEEITLQEVAEYNLVKLADRSKRGVIQGSGGNR
jgi:NTP pyrophosphatase (non-canonical NTP hydrolase)